MASNGHSGVEAAETGESDARERGRECCARDGTVDVAQYVIPTLQGTERRVNEREIGADCNDWISWGNNYSVWPPRTEDLEKLPGKTRRNKTTPVRNSVSYLAGCGTTISAGENFEGPNVWDKSGLSGYLVYLVCFVYLVDLVQLVSFVPPNNQTDQTNQTTVFVGWRAFSASCR